MREIKFRGWDSYKKKMITKPEEIPIYYETDNGFHSGYENVLGDWVNLKLIQFIGLQDKNRNDIYEGDILKSGIKPWVVKWEAPCFKMFRQDDERFGRETFIHERVEIVGNIYQNPELLT